MFLVIVVQVWACLQTSVVNKATHVKAKAKATTPKAKAKAKAIAFKAKVAASKARPRPNIIYTQCPRDRADKVLCDTSCFVNEYLIPDYSLPKLDFSS